MGITIKSKRYSCDMSYGGFGRFRNIVSKKINEEFYKHYMLIDEPHVMFLLGIEREKYFERYDTKTKELIAEGKVSKEIADFLYQSDCNGGIDRKQAKLIYELIKDCADDIVFGYISRSDCAKMKDIKNIFSDNTKIIWR